MTSENSLPQRAYRQLRKRLLGGEFPPGTRLDYKRLSSEIGVSTTPVREAIGQLASDGLVELVPRLGAIVKRLDSQEAIELYGVREALETYAAKEAAGMISEKRLQKMAPLLDRMEAIVDEMRNSQKTLLEGDLLREFLQLDMTFHMHIIEAVRNRRLAKLVNDSHMHIRIFEAERSTHDAERLLETCDAHRKIFGALKERNGPSAGEEAARHMRRSMELSITESGEFDSEML